MLVNNFNNNVVKPTCNSTFTTCALRPVILPASFSFGDTFQSEDVRVSKIIKFKERYSTFGFQDNANLDDGSMWATSWALPKLAKADEAKIADLVRRAVSG